MKRSFDQLNNIGSKYLSLQTAIISSACDESPRPILLRSWLQTPDLNADGLAQMTFVDSGNINVHPNSGSVFIEGLSTLTPQTLTESHSISPSARSDNDNTQIDVQEANIIEIQFSHKDEELHRLSSDISWRVFRQVKDLHSAKKVRDTKFGRQKMVISKGGRRISAAAQEIGRSSAQPLISPQIVAERESGKSISSNVSERSDKRNGSTGDKSFGGTSLLGVEIVQR